MTSKPIVPKSLMYDSVLALKGNLPRGKRLIGLDIGTKTIGLAISDTGLMIATPLETIKRTKFSKDIVRLIEIVKEHNIGGLVYGLPVNMDGSEGPRCQGVRTMARNIAGHIDLPQVFQDERLSTAAVTRTLLEADTSRAKRAAAVDKMAAAYILQGALDTA